jgi:hypothetical protein
MEVGLRQQLKDAIQKAEELKAALERLYGSDSPD